VSSGKITPGTSAQTDLERVTGRRVLSGPRNAQRPQLTEQRLVVLLYDFVQKLLPDTHFERILPSVVSHARALTVGRSSCFRPQGKHDDRPFCVRIQ
jgi:hypothetical protein